MENVRLLPSRGRNRTHQFLEGHHLRPRRVERHAFIKQRRIGDDPSHIVERDWLEPIVSRSGHSRKSESCAETKRYC